jgi:hypothetical protein
MIAFTQAHGTAFGAGLDHIDVKQRNKRQTLFDVPPDVVQGPPNVGRV